MNNTLDNKYKVVISFSQYTSAFHEFLHVTLPLYFAFTLLNC